MTVIIFGVRCAWPIAPRSSTKIMFVYVDLSSVFLYFVFELSFVFLYLCLCLSSVFLISMFCLQRITLTCMLFGLVLAQTSPAESRSRTPNLRTKILDCLLVVYTFLYIFGLVLAQTTQVCHVCMHLCTNELM